MPHVENVPNPEPEKDSYLDLIKELSSCQDLMKLLIHKIEVFKDITVIKSQKSGGTIGGAW